MDISHVAVLENDAEDGELLVQILYHSTGHVTLKVKDLREPDPIDERPNTLVNLSIEHLIKPTSAQLVDKVLDLLLSSGHAEGEVKVDTDVCVVLSRTVMDRGVVVHDGLSYHASDSAGAAVAPLSARLHHSGAAAAALLESCETRRDIELEIAAAA